MPNVYNAFDLTANGSVGIPVPQGVNNIQLSASGSPGGGTLTLECSGAGANDWVPAGRDAVDAQLTVPGTRIFKVSPQFDYRLTMAGSVGSSTIVRWGVVV